jgi:hypothetical protein
MQTDLDFLEFVLNRMIDVDAGKIEQRKKVGQIQNKYRIEIRPIDHPPPHFHITSQDYNASFTIDTCSFEEGDRDRRIEKVIIEFHSKNKNMLVDEWNKTRTREYEKFKIR